MNTFFTPCSIKNLPAFLKSSLLSILKPHKASVSNLFGFIVWKYFIKWRIFLAFFADTGSNIKLLTPSYFFKIYSNKTGLSESTIVYCAFLKILSPFYLSFPYLLQLIPFHLGDLKLPYMLEYFHSLRIKSAPYYILIF